MDSGIDRGGSTSPNISSGNASMENFDDRQKGDLEGEEEEEDGEIPGSRKQSDIASQTSSVIVNSASIIGKADQRTAEEGKERKEEAAVVGPLPGGESDPQRNTVVVLNDGLPEVIVDRFIGDPKGRPRSPIRKPPSGGKPDAPVDDDDDGEPEGRRRLGPAARLVDRVALGLGLCHSAWIDRVAKIQEAVHGCLQTKHRYIVRAVGAVATLAFAVYFCFAVATSGVSKARVLIGITVFVVFVCLCLLVSRMFGQRIDSLICAPIRGVTHTRPCLCIKWCLYMTLFVGVILFVAIDISADVKRLTSLGGMAFFIFVGYVTSKNPSKVKWRPVIWGLGLQFILGVIILRWKEGYYFFQFLGDQVRIFLEFADEGSKFVFGEEGYLMHRMAFKVFPIVIYFSAVISIFYYWGLMQFVVCKIAWLMQFTMGTTAIESLNAACNIFIGMAESCVIMRPFIYKLTKSELHAVMTGGFATVAGSYIALLVEVGASPEHLLSAAIMSAPAALAMAKLSYPETEISHTKTEDDVYMENTPARNLVEAASNGAIAAIKVVSSVAANLIAILGLIAFLNKTLEYVGHTVNYEGLSFETVCSVVFWPLAAIMGVEIQDASKVASLLGTKIFADEFISFRNLGIMKQQGEIMERSIVIATYACCGFGSIAAMGVYIGALISVAPDRRGDISEVAFRAVVNGNVAGFLTACIAGILYPGQSTSDVFLQMTENATTVFPLREDLE